MTKLLSPEMARREISLAWDVGNDGESVLMDRGQMEQVFINVIKNDLPKRLLGTGVKAVVPELLENPAQRRHVEDFMASYKQMNKDNADMLTLLGLTLADTADAVLRNVKNPDDAAAVRAFLETSVIRSVQTIRWSKTRHVGMTADDVAILEYRNGRWTKADPIQ